MSRQPIEMKRNVSVTLVVTAYDDFVRDQDNKYFKVSILEVFCSHPQYNHVKTDLPVHRPLEVFYIFTAYVIAFRTRLNITTTTINSDRVVTSGITFY